MTRAQDKAAEVDKIFSWATDGTPGCVCAVSKNGRVIVNRAYGSADLERNVLLQPNSVFDAGSLSKQFVAAATLLLVDDKKIALSDDIRKYIPELPDYGHTITVDHLLTHTSGIRDWTGIRPLSAKDEEVFDLIVRQRKLNFNPGAEWSYSNSGYVLLKEIVSRVAQTSFAAFASKRLFQPLGMKTAAYVTDMRMVIKDRALAYDRSGSGWKMSMLLDNDRGGGGILCTAEDLLAWNDGLTNNKLGAFVSQKIQEPARLANGRSLSYARGLFIDTTRLGTAFWWHGGSADGYKSVLGRFPDEGLSIAIMCNSGDNTDRVAFARRIFDLYTSGDGNIPRQQKTPPVATNELDPATLELNTRSGLFFNETDGQSLQLVIANDRLRIANGPALVATAKDEFIRWGNELSYMSGDVFSLKFLSADRFELKTMEGKTIYYSRARSFNPNAALLQTFTGNFSSDETGSVLQVRARGNGLTVNFAHTPDHQFDFKPVDTDVFQFARINIRFIRNTKGNITSLRFTNPVVRNIDFYRVEP